MLHLAMDLGIHDYLVNKRTGGATNDYTNGATNGEVCAVASSEDVAAATGADPVLMRRILRNLAALGHVDEVDANQYRANKFSRVFTTKHGVAGFGCV